MPTAMPVESFLTRGLRKKNHHKISGVLGRLDLTKMLSGFRVPVGLSSGASPEYSGILAFVPYRTVPLLRPRAGLVFDRPMADSLCHRSLFSCKDNTLNL